MLNFFYSHIKIFVVRGFLPLNALFFVFFIGEFSGATQVSLFSVFIAIAQVSSNVDGGVSAVMLSTPKVGNNSRVVMLFFAYLKKFFAYKVVLSCLVFIVVVVFKSELSFFLVFGFFFGEALIFYNLISSSCISEGKYGLVLNYIFLILFVEFILVVVVVMLNLELSAFLVCSFYACIFSISSILTFVVVRKLPRRSIDLMTKFSFRLQMSQLSSSLILNKDFIFLYFFGFAENAAVFAAVSRVMMVPSQIISVIIAKQWTDIANATLSYDSYLMQLRKILYCSVMLGGGALIFCFFFVSEFSFYLGISLFLFLVFNSYSGLTSAYATVSQEAIPNVKWYFLMTIGVLFLAFVCYQYSIWWLSIYVSVIYFYILGRKNMKGVVWL